MDDLKAKIAALPDDQSLVFENTPMGRYEASYDLTHFDTTDLKALAASHTDLERKLAEAEKVIEHYGGNRTGSFLDLCATRVSHDRIWWVTDQFFWISSTMSNISRVQRQRGLNYAKALSEIAPKAPDDEIKSKVYGVVAAVRKKYGYSRDEKKREILRCVRLGASTYEDVKRETHFHEMEIRELLRELEDEGMVRSEYLQIHVTGPRTFNYFPINTE
jgi:hypothetical protein